MCDIPFNLSVNSHQLSFHLLIAAINHLVDDALFQSAIEELKAPRWQFGHHSGGDGGVQSFWKMELDDNPVFDEIWTASREKCEALINRPLKVIRQYANGHTFGNGGQAHQDDSREGTYTLLYYPVEKWHRMWEGETVFYDENEDIKSAIKPSPNRAIFFDSRILHVGRPPSRYFGGLRVTVAYKLEVDE